MAKYEFEATAKFTSFEFRSVGQNGTILKRVQFSLLGTFWYEGEERPIFNLAFGDVFERSNEIDDFAITNNGDSEMVLATVAGTAYEFLDHYPSALILFKGSTKARTRLYRMGISKYKSTWSEDLEIMGHHRSVWEKFQVDREYRAIA